MKNKGSVIKVSSNDFWYSFSITAVLVLFGIVSLIPLVSELALSFSSKAASDMNAVTLWPVDFTLESWKYMLSQMTLWRSFFISATSTVIGVALSLVINVLMAYPLAKNDFPLHKVLMLFVVFTMIFKAPTVPYYLQIVRLGLRDDYWVMVLPHILTAYNLIVMRSFFHAFPADIEEAAAIDGCGKFRTLFRIVLPSSKPVLMTVGLYYGVTLWNQYQTPLMFISDTKLFPLQREIQRILSSGGDMVAIAKYADVNYTTATLSAVVVIFATVFVPVSSG